MIDNEEEEGLDRRSEEDNNMSPQRKEDPMAEINQKIS
jgi:hypothetical protein